MPLSEAPQTQKGKQQVFSHGDEIFELLCSKGQIFVQKSSLSIASPQSQQVLSKDAPEPANPVVRRFGTIESDSSTNNLIPNEEIVSWMNYPVDDSLRNDCSSDFLPEMSCGHLSGLHRNTIMVNLDPESRSNQISCVHCKSIQASGNSWEFGDGNFDRTKFHNSRVSSISQFVENFSSDHKTGVCGGKGEIHQSSCQKLNASSERNTNSKSLKQTDTQSNNDDHNNISLINFSHFSRPAALVKATLRSSISASSDFPNNRLGIDNKASLTSTDPSGSVLVETNCRARMVPDRHCRPELGNLKKTATNDQGKLNPCPKNVSGANDGLKNEGSSNGTKCYGSNFAVNGGENVMETLMLSSVCSGSSCGGKSSDNINKLRKKDEAEESYHSEDAEDESGDARKAVGTGAKAKRKRAAEVHNLSERRRRDRINEKMRALQELIPNCNKVDKASMLDEAIEYLKNLQMQVQMLSMGNGLCIPSMMFNTGMSPISTPLMAQLGPVGMGMNMASNYWMGMYDMSMHRSQLPYQPISGFTGLVGMQRPNLPFFGMQGQGVPVPMPSAPYLPFAGFPANAMELQTSNHKSDSKN